jgi:S-formylglutathione hydrolase FrmB
MVAAQAAVKKGTVEKITVHGDALVGNLAGEPADRTVFVYLPPSYATERNRRYPVAYLLHGYGLTGERWMTFAKMSDAADRSMAAGTVKEMILVNPDSWTKNGGSMYSSSPTSGDWETFMAEDLVKYIDTHYRTIATRESRGLGGHSMGGYGTVRIGMKRPDVYSSLYIMSACCLMNDPTPRGGGPGRAGGQRGAVPAAGAAGSHPGNCANRLRLLVMRRRRQLRRGARATGARADAVAAPAAVMCSSPRRRHGPRTRTIRRITPICRCRMAKCSR